MASSDEAVGDAVISGPGKEHYDQEIAALVSFFNEEERMHVVTRYRKGRESAVNIRRKQIACSLEGSRLPFSSLAKDIFEKLSGENDQDQTKSGAVTMEWVKKDVLSVGERVSFGVTNPDADILEDDSPGSLWCWQTRDVKLLPKSFREEILHRRLCRKKIGERISAISVIVDAIRSADEAVTGGEIELLQQAAACLKSGREALTIVDDESAIRAAKATLQQKKGLGISTDPTSVLGEQPSNLNQEQPGSKGPRSDPGERERLRQEKQQKRLQIKNEKEQKRKEKEEAGRKKQQQKQQDEAEKEQRRKEKEEVERKKQEKKQQDEAEKEQRRKEKEEVERKKQEKKQQDEAEKEQRRKEKEEVERKKQEKKQQDEAEKEQKREAERKKQLALKKQASIMDKFLVRKDLAKDQQQSTCGKTQQAQPQPRAASSSPSSSPVAELEKRESVSPGVQSVGTTSGVVARMDVELKGCRDVDYEELLRSHVNNWASIRNLSASKKPNRWDVRRKPKVSVYRELRLNGTVNDMRGNSQYEIHLKKGAENSSPSNLKRAREEFETPEDVDWKENAIEYLSPSSPLEDGKKSSLTSRYHQLRKKKRKLLQFDKSHRPPFCGMLSKRSDYVKPRHPLTQDPFLNYAVDSDEEWEEEDPGESLSDIEKDDEDEKGEVEEIEDDEDGPDEFVVPDGYLSEGEGVGTEDSERGVIAVAGGSFENHSPATPVHQGGVSLERLRKVLDNATEQAIRTNHPLVISNLGQLPSCEDDTQPAEFQFNRVESMCLEALRMRVLVPNLLIGAC